MDLQRLREINEQKANKASDDRKHHELVMASINTQETILKAFRSLVEYLDNSTSKTEVVNQLREIGTPDALKVVASVDSLHETLKTHENTDLGEVTDVLKQVLAEARQIPKENPDIPETKIPDYAKQFSSLEKAVKAVEKVVKEQKLVAEAPVVNVPETQVNVDAPDLQPLQASIKDVVEAVRGIVIPEFKTDNKEVEKQLKKIAKLLDEFLDSVPAGGGAGGGGGGTSWVATNTAGIPIPMELDANNNLKTDSPTYAVRIDDTTTADTTYIGKAAIGSATSGAVWQIAKLDTSSGLIKTWADGDASFNNVWDSRSSLTYS